MKKLRLIKPWRLHAVRQKAVNARFETEIISASLAPCRAPGDGCIHADVSMRIADMHAAVSFRFEDARKAP